MTKKEIKLIASNIIKRSFPKAKMPIFIFINANDRFMSVIRFKFLPILFVDKEVFKMNDKAIIGCLVHELCHLDNNGFNQNERYIDQCVIDKGYVEHLYEFLKYHDTYYENYTKKDGLTKKEVLKQLRQQKN